VDPLRRAQLPGLARLAAAGQIDTGFASLATFVIQVYAVRAFSADELGVFSLAFAAFVAASLVPTVSVFNPYEILAVGAERSVRMAVLHHSMSRGAALGLVSGALVAAGSLPLAGSVQDSFVIAVGVSGWAAAGASALQDHVRRLAHLSGRSWIAAGMSGVLLVGVSAVTVVPTGLASDWVPFGALAAANVISTAVGLAASRYWTMDGSIYSSARISRMGSWLLVEGVGGSVWSYTSAALLGAITSSAVLGWVEGARVVARPVMVSAQGLLAVVGPRSMEAAFTHDGKLARTWRKRYGMALVIIAGLFSLGLAIPGSAGLLADLLPNAFEVRHLALVTGLAFAVQASVLPMQAELQALRRQKALAGTTLLAGAAQVAATVSAVRIGGFSSPLSIVAVTAVRFSLFRTVLRASYRRTPV